MKQNLKDNSNQCSKLLGRFTAEKRRTIIAACLIVVMISMWVRVFTRKGPQSAIATPTAENVTDDQMNQKLKITFVELPKVEGRNDVLTRDFFTVKDWRDFTRNRGGNSVSDKGISIASNKDREKTIRRAAGKLKLEAIVQGENPQAFINDRLLLVGDKFSIKDGTYMFEWEVVEIKEDRVFIKCEEVKATLRLRLIQTPKTGYQKINI